MDLKQLLKQTTIKTECDTSADTTDTNNTTDTTDTNGITEEDVNDDITDTQQIDNIIDESSSETETVDPRFTQPWNKLEKGSKMNRILVFVQSQKNDNELNEQQTKDLKNLLFKGCENGLFNKVSDVKYNEELGEIESFKNLEFNESNKKYKLKTGGTKNRSVSKSRSNIDRLTKKK